MKLREFEFMESILNEEEILNEEFAFVNYGLKYKILFFDKYELNYSYISDLLLEVMVVVYNLNFRDKNYFVDEFSFNKIADKVVQFVEDEFKANDLNLSFREKNFIFEHEDVVWHSLNVAILSYLLGKELNYSQKDLKRLIVAAFFHDVGKMLVDSSVLRKKGKLTTDEIVDIQKHCANSKKLLAHLESVDDEMRDAILSHHEKLDGSGYPRGLHEHEINEMAKIISVTDIFEAMSSDRTYRKGFPIGKVFDMMCSKDFGKLDYSLVKKLKVIILRCTGGQF